MRSVFSLLTVSLLTLHHDDTEFESSCNSVLIHSGFLPDTARARSSAYRYVLLLVMIFVKSLT